MEIRLQTEPILNLQMREHRDRWAKLVSGLGKLSLYEMKKCSMTTDEIKTLQDFHSELHRLILVSPKIV